MPYQGNTFVPEQIVQHQAAMLDRRTVLKGTLLGLAVAGVSFSGLDFFRREQLVEDMIETTVKDLYESAVKNRQTWEQPDTHLLTQPSDKHAYPPLPQETNWYKQPENRQATVDLLAEGGLLAWKRGLIDIPGIEDTASNTQILQALEPSIVRIYQFITTINLPDRVGQCSPTSLSDAILPFPEQIFLAYARQDFTTTGKSFNWQAVNNEFSSDGQGNIRFIDNQLARKNSRNQTQDSAAQTDIPALLAIGSSLPKRPTPVRYTPHTSVRPPAPTKKPHNNAAAFFENRRRQQQQAIKDKQQRQTAAAEQIAQKTGLTRRQFLKKTAIAAGFVFGGGFAFIAERIAVAKAYSLGFELIGADDVLVQQETNRRVEPVLAKVYQMYQEHKSASSQTGHVQVLSRQGELIAKQSTNRYLRFDQVPPVFLNTLTLLEDKRLLSYIGDSGIDAESFINTTIKQILGRQGGGSGLWEQTIKNLAWTQEEFINSRGPVEKAAGIQMAAAAQLYLRDLIIRDNPGISDENLAAEMAHLVQEFYINTVQFGPNITGLADACKYFWGVEDPLQMNTAQALFMTTRPNKPSVFTKDSPPTDIKSEVEFVQQFLQTIVASHHRDEAPLITPDIEAASTYSFTENDIRPVDLFPSTPKPGSVNDSFLAYLQHNSVFGTDGWRFCGTKDGLIQTSIDQRMQTQLAAIIEQYQQGFLIPPNVDVIIRGHDGQIFAMYGDIIREFPIGSLAKPLVYATALESGRITTDTTLLDTPLTIETSDGTWSVRAMGDEGSTPDPHYYTHSNLPLGQALAQSNNPAAALVAILAGGNSVDTAYQRFTLVSPNQPTLGAMDVFGVQPTGLLPLATAYSALGNGGMLARSTPVLSVQARDGTTIYQANPTNQPAISRQAVQQVATMLMTDANFGFEGGWENLIGATQDGVPFYSKTGTPDDQSAVYCAGGTVPDIASGLTPLTVVVRLRWPDPTVINPSGLTHAAPLYRQIMETFAAFEIPPPTASEKLSPVPVIDHTYDITDTLNQPNSDYRQLIETKAGQAINDIMAQNRPYSNVVLHWTGSDSNESALNTGSNPNNHARAHYYITKEGNIHLILDPTVLPGYHVDETDPELNAHSIGIEMVGTFVDKNSNNFPDSSDSTTITPLQIDAAADLINYLIAQGIVSPHADLMGHLHAIGTANADPGQTVVDAVGTLVKNRNPTTSVRYHNRSQG